MKKGILIAPRNATREVLSGVDMQRLLDSGSWLIATAPKKPTRHSVTQKEFEQRRREAGFRKLQVLLPEPIFNKLRASLREGETLALLLERLLAETDNDDTSMVDAHN